MHKHLSGRGRGRGGRDSQVEAEISPQWIRSGRGRFKGVGSFPTLATPEVDVD